MSVGRSLWLAGLLVWRPLARDFTRSLFTILGVALGVSVALAIRLANDSVLTAFRNSLDHVAGRSQLEVSAGEPGLDELLFPAIAATSGIAVAAPVIQAVVPVEGAAGDAILVLGVDVLADSALREYRGPTPDVPEPLRLLTDPDAILLSARYAQAHGIAVGDPLILSTPTGKRTYVVRGLLGDHGVAGAMDGLVAVLDIAQAQLHFGKLGRLDRVDLVLTPGADADRVAADLRRALPADVAVDRPEARNRQVEEMLGSFQLNLFVLSLIALFVGAFLVNNAMAVSVVRQRRQIGILRSLGVSRAGILGIVMGEAAVVGLVGSLLGVAFGLVMARRTLEAVSLTVSSLYAFIAPGELAVPAATIAWALLLGLGVTLVASLAPAMEATRVSPLDDLAPAVMERSHRPWLYTGLGALLLLTTWGLAQPGPIGGRPLLGYLAAFTLLLATVFFCPFTLRVFQAGLAAALRGSRLIVVRLAAGNLRRALRRNGVTMAAMTVGIAMLVSVSTMIASFRHTVEIWIDQTIRADLYVSRVGRLAKGADSRLPADLLSRVRGVPGVAEADGFRGLRVRDKTGRPFILGAGDFDLMARRGRVLFRDGESSQILRQAREQNEVIVSETFAERHGLSEGEVVVLHPAGRAAEFRIAGVYYDYTTEGGLVVMDRRRFQELWDDPWLNSIVLYLAPGADAGAVRRSIREAGGRDDLIVFSNRDLRRRILAIFDQTFAITYALQAIALLVAALGVLTTLVAAVLERTREIGILRTLGFGRVRLACTILAEAGLLGMAANALGVVAGLGLSLILIHVINKQSFGWTIQFLFPIRLIVNYALVAIGVSCLAAVFPAWRASRLPIAEAVRYE
jgi:putative ABC transport system permease protein